MSSRQFIKIDILPGYLTSAVIFELDRTLMTSAVPGIFTTPGILIFGHDVIQPIAEYLECVVRTLLRIKCRFPVFRRSVSKIFFHLFSRTFYDFSFKENNLKIIFVGGPFLIVPFDILERFWNIRIDWNNPIVHS